MSQDLCQQAFSILPRQTKLTAPEVYAMIKDNITERPPHISTIRRSLKKLWDPWKILKREQNGDGLLVYWMR